MKGGGGKKTVHFELCSLLHLTFSFVGFFWIIFQGLTSVFTNFSAYLYMECVCVCVSVMSFTARCALSSPFTLINLAWLSLQECQCLCARFSLLHSGSCKCDLMTYIFLQRSRLNDHIYEYTGTNSHDRRPLKSLSPILTSTSCFARSILRFACLQSYARG